MVMSPKNHPDNCQGFVLVSGNCQTLKICPSIVTIFYEQMVVGGQTRAKISYENKLNMIEPLLEALLSCI
jgi:hypothetical protein